MDLYKSLIERRSIRKYKDKEISNDLLDKIMIAAKHAPTAMNKQNLKFYAVKKSDWIKRLEEAIKVDMDNNEYSLRDAKAFILVASPKDSLLADADTACAMMNMFYAAMSEGIGSCWINQLRQVSDKAHVRPLLDEIDFPGDYQCLGMVALGYPDEVPEHKERIEERFIIE